MKPYRIEWRLNYKIRRKAVSLDKINDALRVIHLAMLDYPGDLQKDMQEWCWTHHWFPHLRFQDEIINLRETLPEEWKTGIACEPQILLQFPHNPRDPKPEISYHTDVEPEWAQGRKYLRIVGVALSKQWWNNGAIMFKGIKAIPLMNTGDAFVMHPKVEHSSGINMTGNIRYIVYFRWISER